MKELGLILLLVLLTSRGLYAQRRTPWQIKGKSLFELKREQNPVLPLAVHPSNPVFYSSRFLWPSKYNTSDRSLLIKPSHTPKAYRYRDLALFCRLEVQMERAFKFPVKFRLGEVQYVERMEGKY